MPIIEHDSYIYDIIEVNENSPLKHHRAIYKIAFFYQGNLTGL
jgi:hypothetical protein